MVEVQRNEAGGYRYAPDIKPYSLGVAAEPGFTVVHVVLARPLPWRQGFERALEWVKAQHRPPQALCGMALRCPEPHTLEGFKSFNDEYYDALGAAGLLAGKINPLARTNVAPVRDAPSETMLYSFSATLPWAGGDWQPTFTISGGGELERGGGLDRRSVVSLGDVSPAGLEAKARCVLDHMSFRLETLGVSWAQVTASCVYTAHPVHPLLDLLHETAGPAAVHGIRWFWSRPPIVDIEYEMDLQGVLEERVVA